MKKRRLSCLERLNRKKEKIVKEIKKKTYFETFQLIKGEVKKTQKKENFKRSNNKNHLPKKYLIYIQKENYRKNIERKEIVKLLFNEKKKNINKEMKQSNFP